MKRNITRRLFHPNFQRVFSLHPRILKLRHRHTSHHFSLSICFCLKLKTKPVKCNYKYAFFLWKVSHQFSGRCKPSSTSLFEYLSEVGQNLLLLSIYTNVVLLNCDLTHLWMPRMSSELIGSVSSWLHHWQSLQMDIDCSWGLCQSHFNHSEMIIHNSQWARLYGQRSCYPWPPKICNLICAL